VRRHLEGEPIVEHFVGADAVATAAHTPHRHRPASGMSEAGRLTSAQLADDDRGV
jgi:hypothetical protein